MQNPMSRQQCREIDEIAIRDFRVPGIVLMENAGRGAAEKIHSLCPEGRVLILCGKGNNGGDGYVIARHLVLLGRDVQIAALTNPAELSGDAKTAAEIAVRLGLSMTIPVSEDALSALTGAADVIVDCLLGTGSRGELRPPYSWAVDQSNQQNCTRVAIDVPSGLDCETGAPSATTFRAHHTCTLMCNKLGFDNDRAIEFLGNVCVIGIGVPIQLILPQRVFGTQLNQQD